MFLPKRPTIRPLASFSLAQHPMLTKATELLGIDNSHSAAYYPVAEYYITQHADEWPVARLEAAANLADANDDLEMLVYGEYSDVQRLCATNQEYKFLDEFLTTVFGEGDAADPTAPLPQH